MFYFHKIFVVSCLAGLLTGCSFSNENSKREINDSDKYLKTELVPDLVSTNDVKLPMQSMTYNVDMKTTPPGEKTGRDLDIRPPRQILTPIKNTYALYNNGIAQLIFLGKQTSWQEIVSVLDTKKIPYESLGNNLILASRSEMRMKNKNELPFKTDLIVNFVENERNQQVINVKTEKIIFGDENITNPTIMQQYAVEFLNDITLQLAKNRIKDSESDTVMDLSSHNIEIIADKDNTGLPRISMRLDYVEANKILPSLLERAGMKMQARNKNSGTYTVLYQRNLKMLSALGIKKSSLGDKVSYNVQLGDLSNRTSLQFSYKDNATKFFNETQNEEMAQILQKVINTPIENKKK